MCGMSDDVERKTAVSERVKRISAIAALIVLIPAAIYGAAFLYNFHSTPVFQAIKEQAPLFVSHAMTTSYLFALAGLVLIAVAILLDNLWKWTGVRSIEPYLKRAMNWCVYGILFCLVATVFGAPIFNWFWHGYFEEQGYSSCSNGVLPLRTEIFYSVWVSDPQFCRDPEVSRILRDEGHGKAGVAEANEYLEETYADNSVGNGDAPVPPVRRSAKTD